VSPSNSHSISHCIILISQSLNSISHNLPTIFNIYWMGCLRAESDQSGNVDLSVDFPGERTEPTHLVVVVNGLIGRFLSFLCYVLDFVRFQADFINFCGNIAQNWRFAAKQMLNKYPQDLVVHWPTSFAPIIERAMTIVEESGGQYHVLLIIADGQVTRSVDTHQGGLSSQEQKTIDAIVRAREIEEKELIEAQVLLEDTEKRMKKGKKKPLLDGEMEKKLQKLAKTMDYLERAKREEAAPLIE
ncbi:unnamed protein product, partial [Arabidopsis halleri]